MVNTAQAVNIRNAFSSVFDSWGSDVTLTPQDSTSQDEWGEERVVDGTPVNTVGVLDNNLPQNMQFTSAGRTPEASSILLLKGTETVDENYKVTINSVDYNILSIEEIKAANTLIVYQLTIGSKN
jgi:hypothetical protein